MASLNPLNISGVSEFKYDTARSDNLDSEIRLNEREVERSFAEMQKAVPVVIEADPSECIFLRKELNSLQHANHLKQQRFEMLTGTVHELNCRLTGNLNTAADAKSKTTRTLAEEVELKAEAEEILRSQLEHCYVRVAKKIAVLKVNYTQFEDKCRRVSRHYVKTQHTEFVALNCLAAASTQKALFLKTMHQTRENYRQLKATQHDLQGQVKQDAYFSLERMSASTLASREKISKKRSLDASILTAIEGHREAYVLKRQSHEALEYYYRLFAEIKQPLSAYDLDFDLTLGFTPQQLAELIQIYKQSIHAEASLKVQFQELSQIAEEKRSTCDNIRAELASLKADDILDVERPITMSLNLLSEQLISAEEKTAHRELISLKEDWIMRIFSRLLESIRTSVACLLGVDAHTKIKADLKLICVQLQAIMRPKPKQSELRISVPYNRSLYRSRSNISASRASTSTPTFSTEVLGDEAHAFKRSNSLNRQSALHQLILAESWANGEQILKEAKELEKSSMISYFCDIDVAVSSSVKFETPITLFTHIIKAATQSAGEAIQELTERGFALIANLKRYNGLLKIRLENSIKLKMPDKLNKVKEDLESIVDDPELYTFKKKIMSSKERDLSLYDVTASLPPNRALRQQQAQSLSRKKAKSCDTSFEEGEEMPKVLAKLQVYKADLKEKLATCVAKLQAPRSLRKVKTGEHRYASLPPSELKSVIQEVKYYDSAIKALYSTEKQAKAKLPTQLKPLLSRKIRVSSSKTQLLTMRSLAGLSQPKSRSSSKKLP